MANLISRLLEEYNGSDFFRVISLLERNISINSSNSFCSSTLRLLSDASLSFPPNDITAVTVQKGVVTAVLSFMGLSGTSSPLPSYFSDLLNKEPDSCMNDFLNIFNHRIYYLFYKAWKKYQLSSFFAFSGLENYLSCNNQNNENTTDNSSDNLSLLPYCGILLTKCRSKYALEIMLTHYFEGKPIHIEEFIQRTKKMKDLSTLESFQLGRNTILGEEYADSCGMFRIVIGPLKLIEYVNFTADSVNIKQLKKIVNSFLTDHLDFDIEVQLRIDEYIPAILGNNGVKLGVTSLLGDGAGQEMIYSIMVK